MTTTISPTRRVSQPMPPPVLYDLYTHSEIHHFEKLCGSNVLHALTTGSSTSPPWSTLSCVVLVEGLIAHNEAAGIWKDQNSHPFVDAPVFIAAYIQSRLNEPRTAVSVAAALRKIRLGTKQRWRKYRIHADRVLHPHSLINGVVIKLLDRGPTVSVPCAIPEWLLSFDRPSSTGSLAHTVPQFFQYSTLHFELTCIKPPAYGPNSAFLVLTEASAPQYTIHVDPFFRGLKFLSPFRLEMLGLHISRADVPGRAELVVAGVNMYPEGSCVGHDARPYWRYSAPTLPKRYRDQLELRSTDWTVEFKLRILGSDATQSLPYAIVTYRFKQNCHLYAIPEADSPMGSTAEDIAAFSSYSFPKGDSIYHIEEPRIDGGMETGQALPYPTLTFIEGYDAIFGSDAAIDLTAEPVDDGSLASSLPIVLDDAILSMYGYSTCASSILTEDDVANAQLLPPYFDFTNMGGDPSVASAVGPVAGGSGRSLVDYTPSAYSALAGWSGEM